MFLEITIFSTALALLDILINGAALMMMFFNLHLRKLVVASISALYLTCVANPYLFAVKIEIEVS